MVLGIIASALILIFSITLVGYQSYNDNSNDKENTDTTNLTENEKNDLKNKISAINTWFSQYYTNNEISEISNERLLRFAYNQYSILQEETAHQIKTSDFDNIIYNFFEGNFKLEHQNIYCTIDNNIVLYHYDKEKKSIHMRFLFSRTWC